jgi:hypothetical protein
MPEALKKRSFAATELGETTSDRIRRAWRKGSVHVHTAVVGVSHCGRRHLTLIRIQGPYKRGMDHLNKARKGKCWWLPHGSITSLTLAGRAFCAAGCSRAVHSSGSCRHTHLPPRISYDPSRQAGRLGLFNSCNGQRRQAIRHGDAISPITTAHRCRRRWTNRARRRCRSGPNPIQENREQLTTALKV